MNNLIHIKSRRNEQAIQTNKKVSQMEISGRKIGSRLIDSIIEDAMDDEGWRDGEGKFNEEISFSPSLTPKSLHFKYRRKFSAYTEIIRWQGKKRVLCFLSSLCVSFLRHSSLLSFLIPFLLSQDGEICSCILHRRTNRRRI